MQSLAKRFPGRFQSFGDICLEQTQDSLRVICVHEGEEVDIDRCIVNRAEELIRKQALLPLLVKLLGFMQQLKDAFCFDYEINNHNIVVVDPSDGGAFDFCLINQILPLQYRHEYTSILHEIYEEPEFEQNEILLVKKVIFLLVALALDDGIADCKALRQLQKDFKTMELPRHPI